jgi:hypothetical protein
VAVRGGNLVNARRVLVIGDEGVTAEIVGGNAAVDETVRPLFQKQCTVCHEARSPANRSLSPEQWAATVDRMIGQRGAEIPKPDRDKIVGYLQALARAGQVSARITVAPNAPPGVREVRVLTDRGASTAFPFEVGALPEITSAEPNSEPGQPQTITPPLVINGALGKSGERDFFQFSAKRGERLTFDLKGYRLNVAAQGTFNPALYLHDATGKTIAKNLGHFDLDPFLDWTAPADGTYTLLVRDLLWRGAPSSVYRLVIGAGPPATVLESGDPAPAADAPDFALTATPDNISVGPGGSVAVLVRATDRRGLKGPITVTLKDAPAGVLVSPGVIPPDDDKTVLVLTATDAASPNAASFDGRAAWVEGVAESTGGAPITRRARPLEEFRINNQRRTQPARRSCRPRPDPARLRALRRHKRAHACAQRHGARAGHDHPPKRVQRQHSVGRARPAARRRTRRRNQRSRQPFRGSCDSARQRQRARPRGAPAARLAARANRHHRHRGRRNLQHGRPHSCRPGSAREPVSRPAARRCCLARLGAPFRRTLQCDGGSRNGCVIKAGHGGRSSKVRRRWPLVSP